MKYIYIDVCKSSFQNKLEYFCLSFVTFMSSRSENLQKWVKWYYQNVSHPDEK